MDASIRVKFLGDDKKKLNINDKHVLNCEESDFRQAPFREEEFVDVGLSEFYLSFKNKIELDDQFYDCLDKVEKKGSGLRVGIVEVEKTDRLVPAIFQERNEDYTFEAQIFGLYVVEDHVMKEDPQNKAEEEKKVEKPAAQSKKVELQKKEANQKKADEEAGVKKVEEWEPNKQVTLS